MTTEAELWEFRSLVLDAQRADKKAKALPKILAMLRSDYRCTPDDQKALADFLDKKKRGRPSKVIRPEGDNVRDDVLKAVREIRQIQDGKYGKPCKRSHAIKIFRMELFFRFGENLEASEKYFNKIHEQLDAELRRAKPRR